MGRDKVLEVKERDREETTNCTRAALRQLSIWSVYWVGQCPVPSIGIPVQKHVESSGSFSQYRRPGATPKDLPITDRGAICTSNHSPGVVEAAAPGTRL